MKPFGSTLLLSVAVLLASASVPAHAQGPLGTATFSGPVRVDGKAASASVSVASATRISTADGATATIALSGGGEIKFSGSTDAVVSLEQQGPSVQLICGQVTVTSSTPVRVVAAYGAKVMSSAGEVMVGAGPKFKKVKAGKEYEGGDLVIATTSGASSSMMVSTTDSCRFERP